ncbi:hypothetical protein N8639_01960, partial [bacterium]|nr:hypothetical protein [bacterium]
MRAFTKNVTEDLYKTRKAKVDKELATAKAEIDKQPSEYQSSLNQKLAGLEAEITRMDNVAMAKQPDYKTACEGLKQIKDDLRKFPDQIDGWVQELKSGRGELEISFLKYENSQEPRRRQLDETVKELPGVFDSMVEVTDCQAARTTDLEVCIAAKTSWYERKAQFLILLAQLSEKFPAVEEDIARVRKHKSDEEFDPQDKITAI